MSDPIVVKRSSRVLNACIAAGVVGLAVAGFVLSFTALRDLAVKAGIDPQLAYLWPLIVDGFIVVATGAAFALGRRGRRVTWYPWTALVIFSALSVAGNAAHAIGNDALEVPVWAATIVSSVPAIALLIASHLLVVMVDGKSRSNGRKAPKEAAPRSDAPKSVVAPPVAATPPAPARTVLHAVENSAPAPLLGQLEEHVAEGGEITSALFVELEGVSERTGRRRVEQLRATRPDLFVQTSTEREAVRV